MSHVRIKAPKSWDRAFYHCVSRVVDRRFIFGDDELSEFLKLMRLYERFCQVRVLAYCLMSNHFHLLVEVPARPPEGMSEEVLFQHIADCYGVSYADKVRFEIEQYRANRQDDVAQQLIDGWLNRMWDISSFMKSLKQRFTQWYNHQNDRVGTLWESRFKSAVIQSGHALMMVATYIDLNPVRAKIVKDPKDYRWCSYGAAVGGVNQSFLGIGRIVGLALGMESSHSKGKEIMAQYRVLLYLAGEVSAGNWKATSGIQKGKTRGGFTRDEIETVRKAKGELSRGEMLRCRVRYFVDGCVIGSREFVEEVFQTHREDFGRNRKTGARRMKGADFGGLCSLRDLQVEVLS